MFSKRRSLSHTDPYIVYGDNNIQSLHTNNGNIKSSVRPASATVYPTQYTHLSSTPATVIPSSHSHSIVPNNHSAIIRGHRDSSRPIPKDSSRPIPKDSSRPLPKDSSRPLPKDSMRTDIHTVVSGRLTSREISELLPVLSAGLYGKEGRLPMTQQRPQTASAIRCIGDSYTVAVHELEIARIDEEMNSRRTLRTGCGYGVCKGIIMADGRNNNGECVNGVGIRDKSVVDVGDGCTTVTASGGVKRRPQSALVGSRRTVTIVTDSDNKNSNNNNRDVHTNSGSVLCPYTFGNIYTSGAVGCSRRPTTAPLPMSCISRVNSPPVAAKGHNVTSQYYYRQKGTDEGIYHDGVGNNDIHDGLTPTAVYDAKELTNNSNVCRPSKAAIRAAEDVQVGIQTDNQEGIIDDAELDAAFASGYSNRHSHRPSRHIRPLSAVPTTISPIITNNTPIVSAGSVRSRSSGSVAIIPPRCPSAIALGAKVTQNPNFFSNFHHRSIGEYLADTKRKIYVEDLGNMRQFIDDQKAVLHARKEIYAAVDGDYVKGSDKEGNTTTCADESDMCDANIQRWLVSSARHSLQRGTAATPLSVYVGPSTGSDDNKSSSSYIRRQYQPTPSPIAYKQEKFVSTIGKPPRPTSAAWASKDPHSTHTARGC